MTDAQGQHSAGSTASMESSAMSGFLIPVPETEALLALSGGALLGRLPAGITGPAGTVRCWEGRVPASVVRELEASAGFGGTVVFRVMPESATVSRVGQQALIQLPVSMSRVAGALVADAAYLDLLKARVEDFPDIVLDAVPLQVDPQIISEEPAPADSLAEVSPVGLAEHGVASARRSSDKVAGAVVGLLAALQDSPGLTAGELTKVWEAVGSPLGHPDSGLGMIVRIGRALSLEEADEASLVLVQVLVERLDALGTRTGFQPTDLLEEVASVARSRVRASHAQVLGRFVEAAGTILRLQPGAPRELLQDGGSIMLRGVLAFMRTSSPERLLALIGKGSKIGPRVGAFGLALAGYYTGAAALPRELKAEPRDRLLALGDVTEAIGHGRPITSRASITSGLRGRQAWVASLFGYEVARKELPLPEPLETLAALVEGFGWSYVSGPSSVELRVPDGKASGAIIARLVDRSPFEPQQPYLELSLTGQVGTRKPAASLEQLALAATQQALVVQLRKEGKQGEFSLSVYLHPAAISSAALTAAVRRLMEAAMLVLEEAPARPRRARARKPVAPASGGTPGGAGAESSAHDAASQDRPDPPDSFPATNEDAATV